MTEAVKASRADERLKSHVADVSPPGLPHRQFSDMHLATAVLAESPLNSSKTLAMSVGRLFRVNGPLVSIGLALQDRQVCKDAEALSNFTSFDVGQRPGVSHRGLNVTVKRVPARTFRDRHASRSCAQPCVPFQRNSLAIRCSCYELVGS